MSDLADAMRLKKLREYLGYSQRELAHEFQVTSGAIAHWETGVRPIPGPVKKLISIYEESLNFKDEAASLVSEEALEVSRNLFKQSIKTLHQEGISPKEAEQKNLARLAEDYFSETFARDRVSGSIKAAIARQVIKSLEGSRGLSIKAAQMASFLELGLPIVLSRLRNFSKQSSARGSSSGKFFVSRGSGHIFGFRSDHRVYTRGSRPRKVSLSGNFAEEKASGYKSFQAAWSCSRA